MYHAPPHPHSCMRDSNQSCLVCKVIGRSHTEPFRGAGETVAADHMGGPFKVASNGLGQVKNGPPEEQGRKSLPGPHRGKETATSAGPSEGHGLVCSALAEKCFQGSL